MMRYGSRVKTHVTRDDKIRCDNDVVGDDDHDDDDDRLPQMATRMKKSLTIHKHFKDTYVFHSYLYVENKFFFKLQITYHRAVG